MESVGQLAAILIRGFLSALIAVVAYQVLIGRINLSGLLEGKSSGQLSPGRVQLLFVTLLGMFYCLKTGLSGEGQLLRALPTEMLALIGGSQSLYLVDKYRSCRHQGD